MPDAAAPVIGGARIVEGELLIWAVDTRKPARPLPLALIIDGQVEFEGFSSPADGVLECSTGWRPASNISCEIMIDGRRAVGPAMQTLPLSRPAARAACAEYLETCRRTWREHNRRQTLQRAISASIERLGRTGEEANPLAPFFRQIARAAVGPRGTGPLALAMWIISDVLEDGFRRDVFCLDDATEAVLNMPAFNTEALRDDVSLALLCFWRRHYQSLDIFSDQGLRHVQYKFVTAPFIRLKTNARLVTPGIRASLSGPTGRPGNAPLPWSWYWKFLHEDQGKTDQLADVDHLISTSFREAVADALDPDRLSFNPPSWEAWWSGWAAGDEVPFSRFDLTLVGLLCGDTPPVLAVVEQGGAAWRDRLAATFYDAMPGLTTLSLACTAAADEADMAPDRCDLAIIGHVNGTGLARNMAMFVDALAPLRPLVFDMRGGRCVNRPGIDPVTQRPRVVLLCVNASDAPSVIGRFAALCDEAHIIGFFLWETDLPPESHRLGASVVDEIWNPTEFVAEAYRRFVDTPIHMVGKGLSVPGPEVVARAARQFAAGGAFTFLAVCDFASSIVRKHPLAVVQAFQAAFDHDNTNVRLILKLREVDRGHWSNIDGYWDTVEELIGGDPRIELLTGDLTEDEYWGLLAACDALVSLHRGEGFSYPVADAMHLGRPVVVSDYSGTTDFCSQETAFPVAVDTVPAPPNHMNCAGPIGQWAEPRHASAVAQMRTVVANRAEAARRGARARAFIAERYDFLAWRASLLSRLDQLIDGRASASGRLTLTSLPATLIGSGGHAD